MLRNYKSKFSKMDRRVAVLNKVKAMKFNHSRTEEGLYKWTDAQQQHRIAAC